MANQSRSFKLASDLSMTWDVISSRLMLVDTSVNKTYIFTPTNIIDDAYPTNDAKSVNIKFRDVSNDPVGQPGDKRGDMCTDTEDLFMCVEDYDGITSIWRRANLNDI